MLIAQFSKIAILAKRSTSFNGETYKYISGVDCTTGEIFGDLNVNSDSPINYDSVQENTIYDCLYTKAIIKGEKNGNRTTAVSLQQRVGILEVKLDNKKN